MLFYVPFKNIFTSLETSLALGIKCHKFLPWHVLSNVAFRVLYRANIFIRDICLKVISERPVTLISNAGCLNCEGRVTSHVIGLGV